jgi:hypothetical protein
VALARSIKFEIKQFERHRTLPVHGRLDPPYEVPGGFRDRSFEQLDGWFACVPIDTYVVLVRWVDPEVCALEVEDMVLCEAEDTEKGDLVL